MSWIGVLGFWGLLVGGVHLYYLAMGSGFIFCYVLVSWMSGRTSKIKFDYRLNGGLVLSVLLPIAIILLISHLTDSVHDRPMAPYGFYVYHATIESVFLPHYGAATTFLSGLFKLSINWEGRAFVGTLALFFIAGFLALQFQNLIRKSQLGFHMISDMRPIIGASVLMLLFSMCLPFEWGLQFIPEIITPLKQFRALGRFSWIFFYVINIAAATYFYRLLQDVSGSKYTVLRPAGYMIIILIWLFDAGSFYLNHGPVSIVRNDKLENTSQEYLDRFANLNIKPNEFQAIFSLPLVAVRTDKMTFEKNLSAHNEAMKCAFHTGLPILQSSASRPSLSQTLSSIQLISSSYIAKKRLLDMDQRPLLMLYTVGSELREAERGILRQGELFWEDQYIQLYRLPLEAFRDSISYLANTYEASLHDSSTVDISGKLRCIPDCEGVIFRSFDDQPLRTKALSGKSSYYSKLKSMIVLDTTLSTQRDAPMEASFWIYIDPEFSGMPSYEYSFGFEKNQLTSEGRIETWDLTEIYNHWVRVSIPLKKTAYHKIIVYGGKTTIDNLMIKSSNQTVFVNEEPQNLYNNYVLP
ncbi:MAG: hypothetical protein IPL46_09015 [Saprospiraceae bacterium]|nr:hypothetical protein [Saprospiraceae bacterium]